jgi:hypothetical protein
MGRREREREERERERVEREREKCVLFLQYPARVYKTAKLAVLPHRISL